MNLKKKEYQSILQEVKNNFNLSVETNKKYFESIKKEVKKIIDKSKEFYQEYKKRDLSDEEMQQYAICEQKKNIYCNALNDIKSKLDNNLFLDMFEKYDNKIIKDFFDYDISEFGEKFLQKNGIYMYYNSYYYTFEFYQENFGKVREINCTSKNKKYNLLSLKEYEKIYNKIQKIKEEIKTKGKEANKLISDNYFYYIFKKTVLDLYDLYELEKC